MADTPDSNNPVRIVQKDQVDVLLVIPEKMVLHVWYRANYDNELIEISKTENHEILLRKYHGD